MPEVKAWLIGAPGGRERVILYARGEGRRRGGCYVSGSRGLMSWSVMRIKSLSIVTKIHMSKLV